MIYALLKNGSSEHAVTDYGTMELLKPALVRSIKEAISRQLKFIIV